MPLQTASLFCLLLALLLANFPFLSSRMLGLFAGRSAGKKSAMHLLEWSICYFIWIAITVPLESQSSSLHGKNWQLWAISVAFFAVLAFPGVTYRYLWPSESGKTPRNKAEQESK